MGSGEQQQNALPAPPTEQWMNELFFYKQKRERGREKTKFKHFDAFYANAQFIKDKVHNLCWFQAQDIRLNDQ